MAHSPLKCGNEEMTIHWGIPPELGSRRALRSGRWLPARAVGWSVTLIFAIMLAFGLAMEAMAHALPQDPALQFLPQLAGAILVLASYAAMVRFGEARSPSELGLHAAPAGIIVGLAIGLAMFAAVMGILVSLGLYRFELDGPASAWHGAGLAIQSGILEEVLVRGVVLRVMWRAFGPLAAFAISAVLFGAGHIANPAATWFTTACIAIEAGVMLGAFYALTGRLWVSIGVHTGWNFTQGYVFGAAVSGSDFGNSLASSTARSGYPAWLTGGAFGPEASLPGFVVCVAVAALVLWLAWTSGRFARFQPDVATVYECEKTR